MFFRHQQLTGDNVGATTVVFPLYAKSHHARADVDMFTPFVWRATFKDEALPRKAFAAFPFYMRRRQPGGIDVDAGLLWMYGRNATRQTHFLVAGRSSIDSPEKRSIPESFRSPGGRTARRSDTSSRSPSSITSKTKPTASAPPWGSRSGSTVSAPMAAGSGSSSPPRSARTRPGYRRPGSRPASPASQG